MSATCPLSSIKQAMLPVLSTQRNWARSRQRIRFTASISWLLLRNATSQHLRGSKSNRKPTWIILPCFPANLAITSLMSLYQHNLQSSQQHVQPIYLAPGNPGHLFNLVKKYLDRQIAIYSYFIYQTNVQSAFIDMFRPYGKIISVRIMIDNATGRSRGFGFVSFEKESSASLAIKQMNGMSLGGKVLKVQLKSQNKREKWADKVKEEATTR